MRAAGIWVGVVLAVSVPLVAAALSPLLAWRDPIYIAAGFAGVIALALLLVQPLLAGRYLPGVSPQLARTAHRSCGILLVLAVVLHIAGLWITSPPDVIDVLLFRSPTPFGVWGAIATWAVFAVALVGISRRRLHLRYHVWRLLHATLAGVLVVGSVLHAYLIEGAMETVTKTLLCFGVLSVMARLMFDLKIWKLPKRRP